MQISALIAVLILLAGAIVTLVVGIFLPRHRQYFSAWLALAFLAATAGAILFQIHDPPGLVFEDSFAVDGPMLWTSLVLVVTAGLVAVLSLPVFRNDARETEYYALLLFAVLGTVMLAGAGDVMEIVLGVLLTSVASYALVAYRRSDAGAMEALLKYYLFGALTNVALIYGCVLLYGLSGHTLLGELSGAIGPGTYPLLVVAIVLVLVGLGFKAGFVPGHFWIPDVYQGTTVPVAAFLSVAPKIAGMLALARIASVFAQTSVSWAPLVALVAAVTMTWGNLAAFRQNDIRRLLGYSTVAQAGYLLMAVVALDHSWLAMPGLVYYFAAYLFANIGAFAVLGASGGYTLEANAGLGRVRPALALAMLLSLLSLVGIPPLAGFVGKYALFSAAIEAGYTWLTVIAIINSVLSLYYYLRVITPMFLGRSGDASTVEPVAAGTALVCTALTVALGIGAFVLLDAPLPLKLLH